MRAATQGGLARPFDFGDARAHAHDHGFETGFHEAVAGAVEVLIQAGLVANFVGGAAAHAHQLEVRFVLFGRAPGDLGQELSVVLLFPGPELFEGGEEMIVAGFAPGDEIAHREAVDQGIAQSVVALGARRRDVIAAAAAGVGSDDGARAQVGAEPVHGGRAQVAFRVDRAAHVVVQVPALGHAQQEGVKGRRIVAQLGEARLDRDPRHRPPSQALG